MAASPAFAQTLERVAATGVFKVGYREDARPFSFKDENGEPNGYAIELCREVAADVALRLGLAELSIDYRPLSTETRFQAVAEGQVDILCGASTVTLARRQIVSFSVPIFQTGISPLMRADAPAFLRDSLASRKPSLPPRLALTQAFTNRKFGARAGTTAEAWLQKGIKTLAANATLVAVDSHDEGLRRILDGRLDAYFADRAILLGLVLASEDVNDLLVGARLFSHEPYGLALARGDESFRLLVDRSLSRIYRSQAIAPIFTRYFGPPRPGVLALYQMNALPE